MTKTNTFSVPKAPLASIVLMTLSAYANASDHAVIHNTVLTKRLSQSPVHEHNASDSIDTENVVFHLETMKVEVCTSNFNDDKSRASSVRVRASTANLRICIYILVLHSMIIGTLHLLINTSLFITPFCYTIV